MERRFRASSFVADHDDPQSSSENGSESPISGDDWRATATAPSPKKSRRSIKKRVVTVPIGDVDGSSRSKGEAYPPSDSWAWRKYGQKPIKGSPYPRGYYRCSSSKGCPARKQVERSRVDPTTLIITYASEHNHPFPTSKHHHHHQQHHHASNSSAAAATSTKVASPALPISSTASPTEDEEEEEQPDPTATPAATASAVNPSPISNDLQSAEQDIFTDLGGDSFLGNSGEFSSWLSDVSLLDPAFVGPRCDDADVTMFPIMSGGGGGGSMREEDESLFADLGELPECSAVFRRGGRGFERCNLGAAPPLCGST